MDHWLFAIIFLFATVVFCLVSPGEHATTPGTHLEPQAAQVPFRLAGGANPLLLVPVQINGHGPYEFILDTGASMCLLTPEVAQAAGVFITASKKAQGAGGTLDVSLGMLPSLELGGLQVHELQVGATDELQKIGARIGAKVDGNIGFNLLKDFRVTIDYRTNQLRLERPAEPARAVGMPFELSAKKPLILLPANVNGKGPFRFVLDTGASATVLSRRTAAAAGLQTGPAACDATGAGGNISTASARVGSITVGAQTLQNLDVIVVDFLEPLSRVVGTQLDGIIGYNFLREFRVVIDYLNESLYLEPTR